jgi:hypothetical protein
MPPGQPANRRSPLSSRISNHVGGFTLTATPGALNQLFPSLFERLDLAPSYNLAPSQNVLAMRLQPGTKEHEAVQLRWDKVDWTISNCWPNSLDIAAKRTG